MVEARSQQLNRHLVLISSYVQTSMASGAREPLRPQYPGQDPVGLSLPTASPMKSHELSVQCLDDSGSGGRQPASQAAPKILQRVNDQWAHASALKPDKK